MNRRSVLTGLGGLLSVGAVGGYGAVRTGIVDTDDAPPPIGSGTIDSAASELQLGASDFENLGWELEWERSIEEFQDDEPDPRIETDSVRKFSNDIKDVDLVTVVAAVETADGAREIHQQKFSDGQEEYTVRELDVGDHAYGHLAGGDGLFSSGYAIAHFRTLNVLGQAIYEPAETPEDLEGAEQYANLLHDSIR